MNVLIVYAHPEPRSFNHALKERAVECLRAQGHSVEVSDLYAMNFKCTIDGDDFPARANAAMLQVPLEQENAHRIGRVAPDIAAEQAKLLWADLVVFQFPLWLYSQPAILKGWMERVFSSGFAHEVKAQVEGRRWFENGGLKGRRALLSLTCAGAASAYDSDGRHGDIDRLLWPIHNALRYSGFDIMPPCVSYAVLRAGDSGRSTMLDAFAQRLNTIWTDAPLPFHGLDDYDETHRLRGDVEPMTPGQWRD